MRRIAAVTLLLLAAACGDPDSAPRPGGPLPSAGAAQVLLRMDVGGGFVPQAWVLRSFPAFTLYGDGRIVTPGAQIEIYPPPALPAMSQRSVTDDGVRRIVEAARAAGLTGESRSYTDMTIADAATTTFTARQADDAVHTTEVYALGESVNDGGTAEQREARRALAKLRDDLGNLEPWLPEGSVGQESLYEPARMRVHVLAYDEQSVPDELPQAEKAWPLDEPLSGAPADDNQVGCLVVEGADLDAVVSAARDANELTPWTSDGARHLLVFRPLLPDESGC